MRFVVAVYAVPEEGAERVFVGQTSVLADTEGEAKNRAVAQLWDDRLTAASCAASSEILETIAT